MYASPQTIADIFFSKLIIIHCMILFCFLLFNIFLLGSGILANLLNKDYSFFSNPVDWEMLLRTNFKSYISILGISTIQYWLSLRFRNFVASIGIGLALLITTLIIMDWEQIYKVPYAFLLLAFVDTKYKKERG